MDGRCRDLTFKNRTRITFDFEGCAIALILLDDKVGGEVLGPAAVDAKSRRGLTLSALCACYVTRNNIFLKHIVMRRSIGYNISCVASRTDDPVSLSLA